VWYSNDKFKAEKGSKKEPKAVDEDVRFPWEYGKFEQSDREATQARLEEAFAYNARTDRGRTGRSSRNNGVVHVTKGKSENAEKRRQKPLLGLPSTQNVMSRWNRQNGSD
jgi:hypothetical protein